MFNFGLECTFRSARIESSRDPLRDTVTSLSIGMQNLPVAKVFACMHVIN